MEDQSVKMHEEKTIVTKEEFLQINEQAAYEMSLNKQPQDDALAVLVEADRHRWIHQNSWFGEPLLNLPQDMFAIQDIVWRTKPEFIIEIGVAWGGGMLFEAMLLEILGGQKVITDVFTFTKNDKVIALILQNDTEDSELATRVFQPITDTLK